MRKNSCRSKKNSENIQIDTLSVKKKDSTVLWGIIIVLLILIVLTTLISLLVISQSEDTIKNESKKSGINSPASQGDYSGIKTQQNNVPVPAFPE